MLASVYSYRVMVKSVSSCCVRGRWVLSDPVTNYLTYSISYLLGNKLSLLFAYTDPSVFIATATANSPNTKQYSCKSVKTPFTCDVWKNTVLGVGSHANTALGFASYCICCSTPPFVLYFPYITHSGALTYVLTM